MWQNFALLAVIFHLLLAILGLGIILALWLHGSFIMGKSKEEISQIVSNFFDHAQFFAIWLVLWHLLSDD